MAGVPIAVGGRQGYTLAVGYFLPPVRFASDVALVLALGSEFMANIFDDDYRVAAQNAYRKIDAILPHALQQQVEQLKRGLQFSAKRLGDDQRGFLRLLRQAVAERRRIRLHYTRREMASNASVHTVREVDPYQLSRLVDDWYLTGYCHLRQAVRMFRLTRIEQLSVLEDTFEPASAAAASRTERSDGQPLFVQVLFERAVARWARESHRAELIDEEDTLEGVRMTLLTHSESDFIRWLLSWGGDVRVLEPAWLSSVMLGHATRMLKHAGQELLED
jgi:predicted DNA-binding transcriptional regulator YafY